MAIFSQLRRCISTVYKQTMTMPPRMQPVPLSALPVHRGMKCTTTVPALLCRTVAQLPAHLKVLPTSGFDGKQCFRCCICFIVWVAPFPKHIKSLCTLTQLCWRNQCCCTPQGLTAGRPGAPSGSSCPSPGQTAAQHRQRQTRTTQARVWLSMSMGVCITE
jgi:hypothetical protein